jgi:Fur family zinc uptake transcriptional regulator
MAFHDPAHDHDHCTSELIARAEQLCARRGTRLTPQRRDVLVCVSESHAAAGAYQIIERMAERGQRLAPIAVYRALDFLASHGLVHKIESRNAFVACSHGHEGRPAALLVCEDCGEVAELDAPETFAALARETAQSGFAASHTVIEIGGRCGPCAGRQ